MHEGIFLRKKYFLLEHLLLDKYSMKDYNQTDFFIRNVSKSKNLRQFRLNVEWEINQF